MLGAIETNKSPVDLTKTTPIAALTNEPEAIVVRSPSKYKTMQQLVDDMKADPAKISFGGGSADGTNQILVGLVRRPRASIPPSPSTSPTPVSLFLGLFIGLIGIDQVSGQSRLTFGYIPGP